MQPFDPTSYELQRNSDNTITRLYRWGSEEPELSSEYYTDRIAQEIENKARIIADLEAQRDKLAAFEAENPPFIIDEPATETGSAPEQP